MPRLHSLVMLVPLLAGSLAVAEGRAPSPDHPLLGEWEFTVPDNGCTEVYRFRPDGTTLVTSGREVSESEYEISDEPDDAGFYRMTDTIVRDNGRPDCLGNVMKAGDSVTLFVRFHPDGDRMVMCPSQSLDACMGPLVRFEGESL